MTEQSDIIAICFGSEKHGVHHSNYLCFSTHTAVNLEGSVIVFPQKCSHRVSSEKKHRLIQLWGALLPVSEVMKKLFCRIYGAISLWSLAEHPAFTADLFKSTYVCVPSKRVSVCTGVCVWCCV